MELKSITANEFQAAPDRYMEAARKEPLVITKEGTEALVMIPRRDYDHLLSRDREALLVSQLSNEDIKALENVKWAEETKKYDHELDE